MSDNRDQKSFSYSSYSSYSSNPRPNRFSSSNRPSSNQPHFQQSANEHPPSYKEPVSEAGQQFPDSQILYTQHDEDRQLSSVSSGEWLGKGKGKEKASHPGSYSPGGDHSFGGHQQNFPSSYSSSTGGYGTSVNSYGNTSSYLADASHVTHKESGPGYDRGGSYRHHLSQRGKQLEWSRLGNGEYYIPVPPKEIATARCKPQEELEKAPESLE
ncbi:hypothetical protein FQN51_007580 [Onygenales sp. PD_10]|nr:hypothetical protein FQN51_007580 [Onygenales sp. PD_10]